MPDPKRIEIDGRRVPIEEGDTILSAARRAGIDIPTLCHLDEASKSPSCMVCLVKDLKRGRLVPSCSALAEEGMEIDASSSEVATARKTALEMLLSEHLGDCEGPCEMACPLMLDIPRAIRAIRKGDRTGTKVAVSAGNPLPRSACRICHAPCEKACRRGRHDAPVAIRALMLSAFPDGDPLDTIAPSAEPTGRSGKRVAVVGAGPAGLACAAELAGCGHGCVVFERAATAGGALRSAVPAEALDADIAETARKGVGIELGAEFAFDSARPVPNGFDALVIATGRLKKDAVPPLGLETDEGGVTVDPATYATSIEGVFAVGGATFPESNPIQSMADAVSAARAVDAFLGGAAAKKISRETIFNSRFGALEPGDMATFLASAGSAERFEPEKNAEFEPDSAKREAERCLDCDCAAADSCELRGLATEFGVDTAKFREDRGKDGRGVEFVKIKGAGVVLETGKCVLCGRCVETTRNLDEGLVFIGRGYDCVVGPPLDAPLERALGNSKDLCVERCPTGAISRASRA